jgi:hypothetical protein
MATLATPAFFFCKYKWLLSFCSRRDIRSCHQKPAPNTSAHHIQAQPQDERKPITPPQTGFSRQFRGALAMRAMI